MEIRIVNPDRVVKMLELKLQGYSNYKIGKEVGVPPITVKRTLERFEKDWPALLKFIKDARRTHYFLSLHMDKQKKDYGERMRKMREQLLTQGKPIAPANFNLPGYKLENNEVKVDPETVPTAQKIFEAYLNGENMRQLFKDLGLQRRTSANEIVRNPIYIGQYHYRGKVYHFPQLAIIDEKLWMECQPLPISPRVKRHLYGGVPFGFKRRGGRFVKDPEKAKVVERIYDLFFEGKNMSETAREFESKYPGMKYVIYKLLRNPKYAGKIKVEDKYVDVPFETIIPFEKWLKTQVLIETRARYFSREKRIKLRILRRDKVLRVLMEKPEGELVAALKEAAGFPLRTLRIYLCSLRREGLVEWKRQRTIGRPKRWYITELGKQYLRRYQ